MALKKYIYFLISLTFLFTSCVDDDLKIRPDRDAIRDVLENGYDFSFMVDDPSIHSRDVNFQPGAALRLNTVWIGIFDQKTGACISNNYRTLNFATITSGVKHTGIVRMDLKKPQDSDGNETEAFTTTGTGPDNDHPLIAVCISNIQDVEYDYRNDQKLEDSNDTEDSNADNFENGNYAFDVYDEDIDTEIENPKSLKYKLSSVKNWDEFNEIAVDAITAYQGSHNSDTPVLAGFLYDDSKEEYSHIKIDQFAEAERDSGSHKVCISPDHKAIVSGVTLKYGEIEKDKGKVYYTDTSGTKKLINTAMTLHMRRLVANINVNITMNNDHLELTNVSYMRYNIPNYVYIIERRTTDCGIEVDENTNRIYANPNKPGKFATDASGKRVASLSPNYADKYINDNVRGYSSDQTWQQPQNLTSFSFQHFANKHWSDLNKHYKEVKDQDEKPVLGEDGNPLQEEDGKLVDKDGNIVEREEIDSDGVFKALLDETGSADFNNYASYFVIKMHLVDKTTGKAYDALYTIHEGNTSDELGNEIPWKTDAKGNPLTPQGNPKDYVCARNINYYYNVVVNGVNNIYHNVSVGSPHYSGQGGKIWELHYVNNTNVLKGSYDITKNEFINPVPPEGGFYPNAIHIDNDDPEIAFRLYGYNTDVSHIEGFNYGFPEESFTNLKGLWPESAGNYSHYYKGYDQLMDPDNYTDDQGKQLKGIPDNLNNGLRFIPASYLKKKNDQGEYDENGKYNEDELEEILKDETKAFNIIQFVKYVHDNAKKSDSDIDFHLEKDFHLYVYESPLTPVNESEKTDYVRAIYIADRKGTIDKDGCTTLINIFCGAQYPKVKRQKFEMIYASDEPLPPTISNNGYYQIENDIEPSKYPQINGHTTGAIFTDDPDLAFRIYGYTSDGKYYDICYNFNPDDYPSYKNEWPEKKQNVTQVVDKGKLGTITIPTELLEGLLVRGTSALDPDFKIIELINNYEEGTKSGVLGFKVNSYNYTSRSDDPKNDCRGLYIFDTKLFSDNWLVSNESDPLYLYPVYGIKQLPKQDSRKPVSFDASNIIWHKDWFSLADGDTGNHWCSGRDASTDFVWKHADGIISYKVEVVDITDNNAPKPEYANIMADEYKRVNPYNFAEEIIICPFPIPRYSKDHEYQVTITPTIDESTHYFVTPEPLVLENAIKIKDGTQTDNFFKKDDKEITIWDFSKAPWTNLSLNNLMFTNKPYEYNGLVLNHKRNAADSGRSGDYPNNNGYYFQFGTPGKAGNLYDFNDADKISVNNFCVYISQPGSIIVYASNTGGTADAQRHIFIQEEGKNAVQMDKNGLAATTNVNKNTVTTQLTPFVKYVTPSSQTGTFNNKPTKYYIYCDNNCRFYKIIFKRGKNDE